MRTERAILLGLLICFLTLVRVPRADVQAETSQLPVQADVSSEASVMLANAPPAGLIHLDVAATDREGKPLSALAAKDFTMLDNRVPQKIVSFAASNQATDENERLTEVVLVLDEVNLSSIQFQFVKDESIKYLRQNGGHLAQPVSIYWFTTFGLYASAQPTTDGNVLAEDVAHNRSHRVLWQSRHIVMCTSPQNQRGTDGTEPSKHFIASPSSGETSRAGRFWCGWASGGLLADQ